MQAPPLGSSRAEHGPEAPERFRGLRRGGRILSYLLLAVLNGAAVLIAAVTLPTLFGHQSYIVYGGSMGAGLPVGSVAIADRVEPASLAAGDIIAVDRAGGDAVLHRIVEIEIEGGERVATTRGDENDTADAEHLVLGGHGNKVTYVIPYAGYLLHYTGSRLGNLLFIVLPVLLLAAMVLHQAWHSGSSGKGPATLNLPEPDGRS